MKHFAININWDIDIEEAVDAAMELSEEEFKNNFGINIDDENAEDIVKDKFHHCPGLMDDIIGVPSSVEIPDEIMKAAQDEDDDSIITDWLSDEYGWCINGYGLSTDKDD